MYQIKSFDLNLLYRSEAQTKEVNEWLASVGDIKIIHTHCPITSPINDQGYSVPKGAIVIVYETKQ